MSESGMFCVQSNAEDFRSCCSILCIHSVLYISTASYQTESEAMQLGLSHCSVQYSNGIPALKICVVSYTACLPVINHYTVQYLHRSVPTPKRAGERYNFQLQLYIPKLQNTPITAHIFEDNIY